MLLQVFQSPHFVEFVETLDRGEWETAVGSSDPILLMMLPLVLTNIEVVVLMAPLVLTNIEIVVLMPKKFDSLVKMIPEQFEN